jgi:hypothetical protein
MMNIFARKMMLLFVFALLSIGAGISSTRITASQFRSERIKRELDFYVATHLLHPVNHFYVGATKVDHGRLNEALVYWKEERLLLPYTELNADASHDIFAWQGHELKLDRDTVDTPDEIAGSDYLITHRQWVGLMEECISMGKLYCVFAKDAEGRFSTDGKLK